MFEKSSNSPYAEQKHSGNGSASVRNYYTYKRTFSVRDRSRLEVSHENLLGESGGTDAVGHSRTDLEREPENKSTGV